MRQLLAFLCVGVLTVFAGGCDGEAASAPGPTRSGEFRVLIPARPATFNPNLDFDEPAYVVGNSLFNHLVAINESGRLLPDLAESWTVSPDGRTYTFALRKGVRWHDGMPFTSADVKWTLEAIAADGQAKDSLAPVERITTPDAATIVLTLKYPWAPFVSDLSGVGTSILPRHLYEGTDWRTNPANRAPVGTGPFRFSRWADAATLVLEANASFFRAGPFVERLIFEVAPADTVAARLRDGSADYAVTRPDAPLSTDLPEPLLLRTLPTSARSYLAMNLRRAPLDDVRVRRALAAAVDRDDLVRSADGLGAPAVGWYTPDVAWAYNADARVPDFDPEAARRLLAEAAYDRAGRSGARPLAFVIADVGPVRLAAAALERHFSAIGVTVDLVALPLSEWLKRVINAHDFDLTIVSGVQGPDPDALRRRFLAGTVTGGYIGYDDPRFRAAVEEGARATDVARRAAAYYRAQEILAEDVPFIPLVESVKVLVYNRRVSGLPQLEARALVGAFDFSLVRVGAPAATSPP